MSSPEVSSKLHLTFNLDGQIYFIKGWHLREFGFPRANDLRKNFKWKKMNFTTDLPKQDPICSYLVATGKVDDECYRMHVVVNSNEYNKEYRRSDVLKELKSKMEGKSTSEKEKDKQKLLPCDRNSNTERIILCHVIRINNKTQAGDGQNRVTESRKRSRTKANKNKKHSRFDFEESEYESFSSEEIVQDSETVTDDEQLYEEDLRL